VRPNTTAAIEAMTRTAGPTAGDGRDVTALPRLVRRGAILPRHRQDRGVQWDPRFAKVVPGGSLGVAFQPILQRRHLDDGRLRWEIAAAEALVRAHDNHGAALRPDKLLPLLERAGLMHRLFLFVLTESLAAAQSWERNASIQLEVSVNLHVAALLDDALPSVVLGLLNAADFAPARVTLELTEGAPIADLHHAAENLRALRASGLRVSLDDFGAGFSTTTRLDWLDCDELKIDRALVIGLERCDEKQRVVESLIELAHARGMCACAEGIETAAALRLLGAIGCDRAQGYLIARPAPSDAMFRCIREWRDPSDDWLSPDAAQLWLPGFRHGIAATRGAASPLAAHSIA
jgi:EAL domain-containing protein (putative c-di-GMP-specific phosphodiesterase class I)